MTTWKRLRTRPPASYAPAMPGAGEFRTAKRRPRCDRLAQFRRSRAMRSIELRCAIAHLRTSRFRVWSFEPFWNDDVNRSRLVEQRLHVFPVHEVLDERLEVVRAAVAIVDVVGVLPDVAAEDRGGAVHQRILAVRGLGDFELAVLDLQPAPAGAELTDARGLEIGLELVEAAEVLVDLLLELARQLGAAAIGLHPAPEVDMVIVLAGIVEDRRVLAERALDDLLKGLAFPFGPLERVVAVGDIGLVMLVVVIFQRFLRHMGPE